MAKKISKEEKDKTDKLDQITKTLEGYDVNKNDDSNGTELDVSDQNIDALKYALYHIIHNKGSLAGTTNLNKNQIRALSRIKALNYFYKSHAITQYCNTILELQRSQTSNPVSILESIGNLFKFPHEQTQGLSNRVNRLLRR